MPTCFWAAVEDEHRHGAVAVLTRQVALAALLQAFG
ncbi:hypothetical protein E2C01_065225 [Portunus trituberculatus]|uniref:Uncharacterized protein n=1 Tax=Portunus trituberculatus TaxID=210409 RepID=A0A5B7HMF3_PORTR|nr:hypothetical protein [Portunus trituberculatus]